MLGSGQETCGFIRSLLIAICVTLSKMHKGSELSFSPVKSFRIIWVFYSTPVYLIYFIILLSNTPYLSY